MLAEIQHVWLAEERLLRRQGLYMDLLCRLM